VKYLPKWLPGSGFLRLADDMNNLLHDATERPYQLVKRRMQEGKQPTSFLSEALKDTGNSSHLENIYKWSASSMYFGGADTTVSSLMTFFLAMVVFPDVQRKAQEELDRVIGGERLPVTTDLEKLPYIEAVLKETHRWWPVAPMGLPHRSTEDDEILGYRLPKGTTFLPNNWWFTHDPSVYPKPMEFIPERFLATKTHAAETDPRTWTFGYGRRVCPGRYVADNALFITIAQTLATFNISKAVENGKVVEPEVKFESGVVSHPKPFKASIVPRSEKHAALVRRMEQEYPWEKSDAEALKSL
jgi:cytochrome P450